MARRRISVSPAPLLLTPTSLTLKAAILERMAASKARRSARAILGNGAVSDSSTRALPLAVAVVRLVLCRLSPAHDAISLRVGREGWAMPGKTEGRTAHGVLAAISTGMVGLLHEHTGRGPVRARTTIDDNIIVCVLGATLTKGEQQLVENGKEKTVLRGRRAMQGHV